ncbi:MAG: RHS repeat-associated core domain-containing protein [Phycisphaerales bacterium]|nr:RHS repeat-associated core domain-containing protein [Phycisphaerales bacterium]
MLAIGDDVVTISDISGFNAALRADWTGLSVAYDWDAENRLVRVRPVAGTEAAGVSKVEFEYDSGWRRVRKTVTPWDEQASGWAGTPSLDRRFLWSGWRMLLEFDILAGEPNEPLRALSWGLDLAGLGGSQGGRASAGLFEQAGTIGGLLAVREYDLSGGPSPADPVDYVYLYDANGNVGQVVDWSHDAQQPGAALAARYEYDPYGGVTKAEGSYAADNAWRFSTKQWDDETGLGYWGYRYYSPSLGRWVSRDPLEELGGLHLYVYANNAAVVYYDSFGLMPPDSKINRYLDAVINGKQPSPPPSSQDCGPGVLLLVGKWCASPEEFDAAAAAFWATAQKQVMCIFDCEVTAHACLCVDGALLGAAQLIPLDKVKCFEALKLRLIKGSADTTNFGRIVAELVRQKLGCTRAAEFMHKVMNEIKRTRLGPGLRTSIVAVESGIAIVCSVKCLLDDSYRQ